MDIQSFLRLQGLFGSGANLAQPGLDTYSSPEMNTSNPMPIQADNADLMNQYQPRHSISDQLTSTLGDMPERPVPGRLRNIGAALAGFGVGSNAQAVVGGQPIGFKFNPQAADYASDKVKYGDFDNQLADWQNKVKSLGIGATEEDRANAGEITRLKNNATNEINQQKVDVANKRADAYQQNADTKIKEEADKHEYSMQKLRDNVESADKKLVLAKQNFDLKKNSTEAMQAYHNAELASIAARREAQTEDDKFKLEDTKRRTDSILERNKILNEAIQGKETDTSVTYDKAGNVVGKKVTSGLRQSVITDPETGHKYDTSSWSNADKAAAAAKGWR